MSSITGDASRSVNPGQTANASLRKRWLYLLPAVFVTYSLAYLDRANYGFGAAAGLSKTLHITDKQSSLLASLFFLGYFIFQLPGAAFARKHSVSRLVFVSLIAWGTLAALTGVIHQFGLLALDRFLLGVAESFIFPAMLVLLTRWFTRAERSRANAILILGNPVTVLWMSAITGYLIQSFGWQRTFIFEGIPSVAWALVWLFVVSDKPSEAGWMTSEAAGQLESILAAEQLLLGQPAIVQALPLQPPVVQAPNDPQAPSIEAVRRALLRPDVLLLSVQFFFWSVGVYGFVLWLPSIVRQGSALSMGRTGLLSAIPYLVAIVLMLLVSHISDKTQRRQALVWPFLLLAGFALLGAFIFATKSFPVAFGFLVLGGSCMYAPYGAYWAIIPERLPRNVTAEVLALVNSCGALGSFVGSYLVGFLHAVTGNSQAGFLLMSGAMVCSALLMLCLPDLRSGGPSPASPLPSPA